MTYDEDLRKYHEILERAEELEKEIPPNRKRWQFVFKKEPCFVSRPLWMKGMKKRKRNTRWRPRGSKNMHDTFLKSKVNTFESMVATTNLYSKMVEMIRDYSGDIDFGIHWGLLSKNIAVESERFCIENKEADELARMVLCGQVSTDIDAFCRELKGYADLAPLV